MSKVKITKAQAEFIEGFKKLYEFDNEKTVEIDEELPMWSANALRNLTQFGFGYPLLNANNKEVSNDENDPEENFQHDQVPLLIEAIVHGYEVKKEKVVLYIMFSDKGYSEDRKLYYGSGINVTNKNSATEYDLNLEREVKKVEELKAQGWKVEEVK